MSDYESGPLRYFYVVYSTGRAVSSTIFEQPFEDTFVNLGRLHVELEKIAGEVVIVTNWIEVSQDQAVKYFRYVDSVPVVNTTHKNKPKKRHLEIVKPEGP